jgi:hypothetical protein
MTRVAMIVPPYNPAMANGSPIVQFRMQLDVAQISKVSVAFVLPGRFPVPQSGVRLLETRTLVCRFTAKLL